MDNLLRGYATLEAMSLTAKAPHRSVPREATEETRSPKGPARNKGSRCDHGSAVDRAPDRFHRQSDGETRPCPEKPEARGRPREPR